MLAEQLEQLELRHVARRHDVLGARRFHGAGDDRRAELREVQGGDAVPAVVDVAADRRFRRLAAEPPEVRLRGPRLRADDRGPQVVDVGRLHLAEALRLAVDVERVVGVGLDVVATDARVDAVGRDLNHAGSGGLGHCGESCCPAVSTTLQCVVANTAGCWSHAAGPCSEGGMVRR